MSEKAKKIPYPGTFEKQQQIQSILSQVYSEGENKKIVNPWNMGFPAVSVAFSHKAGVFGISMMLYLITLFVSFIQIRSSENIELLVVSGSPVLYLLFTFFSNYMEEQEGVRAVIQCCKYSLSYLNCIRMFYVSLISILLNSVVLLVFSSKIKYMLSLEMIGGTSLFLFAIISLYLYEHFRYYKSNLVLLGIWITGFELVYWNESNQYYLRKLMFQTIPFTVHLTVCVVTIFLFLFMVVLSAKRAMKEAIEL